MSGLFTQVKEALSMKEVAEKLGFRPNRAGFVYSPYSNEKTPSCKLYAKSFYDFSNGTGGDLVKFTADVLGVNNWKACEYLIREFNLPFSLSGSTESQKEIERRENEREREREKEKQFREDWIKEVDSLKRWEELYQTALYHRLYEPGDYEMLVFIEQQLAITQYKLEVLCISGSREDVEKLLNESRTKS